MNSFTVIDGKFLKLPNGRLLDKDWLKHEVKRICHYVNHVAIVVKDGKYPIAVIFPNKKLLTNPDYEKSPEEGCFCPRNLKEIGKCLFGCMQTMNLTIKPAYATLDAAVIIDSQLSVEDGTLTPDLDEVDSRIVEKYRAHMNNIYGGRAVVGEETVNMKFNTEHV